MRNYLNIKYANSVHNQFTSQNELAYREVTRKSLNLLSINGAYYNYK